MANEWIEWAGGECPVASDVRVETISRRYGRAGIRYADSVDWKHRPIAGLDIIAYRIVEPA